jgi:hypothetical protein
MQIRNLPLIVIAQFTSILPEHFSIDEFIVNEKMRIGTACNGMNDKNFPLKHECQGAMNLFIFKTTTDMETRPALRQIAEDGWIFTGVKGIASLIMEHIKLLPVENWILSPNRLIEDTDIWQSSGIPYLLVGSGIKYSNHSIDYIRDGKYLLLGRKAD